MDLFRKLLTYSSVNALFIPFNLAIAWQLTEVGVHYLVATIIGISFQVVVTFFANRKWTFNRPDITVSVGLVRTSLVEVGSITVAAGVTAVCVEYVDLAFWLSRSIAVLAAGAWSFVLDLLFTFRSKRAHM